MRAFSNEGVMDLAVEVMLLRRKQARGQNQAVQVIKARHVAKLEQVKVHFERRWVLLKIPRCDIDGVGEGK